MTCLLALVLFGPVDRTVYQVGSLGALLDGKYAGTGFVRQVLARGDFGLGTYAGLDGEGVILDGIAYRVDPYGKAHVMSGENRTPFMFATRFRSDLTLTVGRGGRSMLEQAIDRAVPQGALAIRVDGDFSDVTARSFPQQFPPYLGLGKIMDRQALLPFGDVDGTLVGFRLPKSICRSNSAGYHFHFLTPDREQGGHVLSYGVTRAVVRIMRVSGIKEL